MNERIKELMRESRVKTLFPGDPGTSGVSGPPGVSFGLSETQKLEKFAELIVEECRIVVAQVFRKTPMELCGPLAEADNEIARHFGVEE